MESQKVYIRHVMLWNFKQENSAFETAKKCTMCTTGVIIDQALRNKFARFNFGDKILKDEPMTERPRNFNGDILKAILNENPNKSARIISKSFKISQPINWRHLVILGKF